MSMTSDERERNLRKLAEWHAAQSAEQRDARARAYDRAREGYERRCAELDALIEMHDRAAELCNKLAEEARIP